MSDTYRCLWCGHNGTRINEQAIRITRLADGTWADGMARPGTAEQVITRYVCWKCGQDVKPN